MTDISLQITAKTARRGRGRPLGRPFGATVCEAGRAAASKQSLFLAPVFPMELTDDAGNGAPIVDADGAGPPHALGRLGSRSAPSQRQVRCARDCWAGSR